MGKKPSKCFPAIQALCLILTNFLHKILPPENSHAKSEKKIMLQKIAQLPTPTKSNDPSLSESVYVAYCPSLCAIGNQLLGLWMSFAITLVSNIINLLQIVSFSQSLLYQPLILLSVSFSLSLSDPSWRWANSYFQTWVIRDFIIVGAWIEDTKNHDVKVETNFISRSFKGTGSVLGEYQLVLLFPGAWELFLRVRIPEFAGTVFACTRSWIRAPVDFKAPVHTMPKECRTKLYSYG